MKKTLGYGYKLARESLNKAMSHYGPIEGEEHGFHKTKEEVEKAIQFDKKEGSISKKAKPQVFKVVVEII